MNNSVKITVTGYQDEVSEEPTVVETIGTLHTRDGLHYIRYTDPEGLKTLIKIKPGYAIVTRSGAVSSVMEFIQDDRTECVYPTPYGTFDTVINTHSVTIVTREDEPPAADVFSAGIVYDLTLNDQRISKCRLEIKAVQHGF